MDNVSKKISSRDIGTFFIVLFVSLMVSIFSAKVVDLTMPFEILDSARAESGILFDNFVSVFIIYPFTLLPCGGIAFGYLFCYKRNRSLYILLFLLIQIVAFMSTIEYGNDTIHFLGQLLCIGLFTIIIPFSIIYTYKMNADIWGQWKEHISEHTDRLLNVLCDIVIVIIVIGLFLLPSNTRGDLIWIRLFYPSSILASALLMRGKKRGVLLFAGLLASCAITAHIYNNIYWLLAPMIVLSIVRFIRFDNEEESDYPLVFLLITLPIFASTEKWTALLLIGLWLFGNIVSGRFKVSQIQYKLQVIETAFIVIGCGVASIVFINSYMGPTSPFEMGNLFHFGSPPHTSCMLLLSLTFVLHKLTLSKRTALHIVLSIVLTYTLCALFMTYSKCMVISVAMIAIIWLFQNVKKRLSRWTFTTAFTVTVLLLVTGFYQLAIKDTGSTSGRMLIWRISAQMIADRPILGFGHDGFIANYMEYQARYFMEHPDHPLAILAGNISHPLNEFIDITINYGIVGLIGLILLTIIAFWRASKAGECNRKLYLSILSVIIVYSLFSYPFKSWSILLLLVVLLFYIFRDTSTGWLNKLLYSKWLQVAVCAILLPIAQINVKAYTKWRSAQESFSKKSDTSGFFAYYNDIKALKNNTYFLYNYGAVLNANGEYEKSNDILLEHCKNKLFDYDVCMLIAQNYEMYGNNEKALEYYQIASYMIPHRFIPLHRMFQIYRNQDDVENATKLAKRIVNKTIKVPSLAVSAIQDECKQFLYDPYAKDNW